MRLDHWSRGGKVMPPNSKNRKIFLRSRYYVLNSWSRYSLKKSFLTHFNTGPLAKGLVNHSLEIRTPKSSNVSLSCWIDWDNYCPQELLWKFNDKPEPLPESGNKYNAELKNTNTKYQREFVLSIFDVTQKDEGTYSCH